MSIFTDFATSLYHSLVLGDKLEKPGKFEHYVLERNPPAGTLLNGVVENADDVMYPADNDKMLRICTVSDTHSRHYLFTNLPTSDIILHTGDIFMHSRMISTSKATHMLKEFNEWLGTLPAPHKIVIGGNHDNILEDLGVEAVQAILTNATYLCNSYTIIHGVTIWGTPLSHGRSGNAAFQSPEFEAATIEELKHFEASKQRIDILLTHGPCTLIGIGEMAKPRIMHVSGHVHAHHGVRATHRRDHADGTGRRQWYRVSAPIMDARYHPTQLPVVVDVMIPQSKHVT